MNPEKLIYSIIIPHKDRPELLRRCLSSIPDRADIQVVVVDDNSSDRVISELTSFTKANNVEFIYTKAAKGAGYARNIGLDHAVGKWILFADSDDYYVSNAFDVLDRYIESDNDLIYVGSTSSYSDSMEKADRHMYYQQMIDKYLLQGNEFNEYSLRLRYLVPWGKMIKRSLISENNIRFEEVIASNDIMFSAQTGFLANKICVEKEVVYCVTVNKGSLINTRTRESDFARFCVKLRYNKYVVSLDRTTYQYTIRKPVFDAFKNYGIREFLRYIILARHYNVSLFYNLNVLRVIKSYMTYVRQEKRNKKYIEKS